MAACNQELRQNVAARLSRIEGQLRGIRKMVEEERDCYEIAKQVGAASGALRSLQKVIIENHLETCLIEAAKAPQGRKQIVHDLVGKMSDALH